jgi:hypothetical protein
MAAVSDDPIEAAANYLAQGKISQADYAAIFEGRAHERIAELRSLLSDAGEKLSLYRKAHSGEYIGGAEYTDLMQRIIAALAEE